MPYVAEDFDYVPRLFHVFSMLHGTLPNCSWLGTGGVMFPVFFSNVEGGAQLRCSDLLQYLMVFDTMCKILSSPVLR